MKLLALVLVLVSLSLLAGCGDNNFGNGPAGPLPCPTGDVCTDSDAAPPAPVADANVQDAGADSAPAIDPAEHAACVARACGTSNCGAPDALCDGEAVSCGTCTGNSICGGNTDAEGTNAAGLCNDDCLSTTVIAHGACATVNVNDPAWGVLATCTHAPYTVASDGTVNVRPAGGAEYQTTIQGQNYNCWAD